MYLILKLNLLHLTWFRRNTLRELYLHRIAIRSAGSRLPGFGSILFFWSSESVWDSARISFADTTLMEYCCDKCFASADFPELGGPWMTILTGWRLRSFTYWLVIAGMFWTRPLLYWKDRPSISVRFMRKSSNSCSDPCQQCKPFRQRRYWRFCACVGKSTLDAIWHYFCSTVFGLRMCIPDYHL